MGPIPGPLTVVYIDGVLTYQKREILRQNKGLGEHNIPMVFDKSEGNITALYDSMPKRVEAVPYAIR